MRVLCHCAHAKDPTVDKVTRREVAGLTISRVERFETLELLDRVGGNHEVHDWAKFIPKDATNAERQARWRGRRNGVTGNVTKRLKRDVT
jgi:hypothetical protein